MRTITTNKPPYKLWNLERWDTERQRFHGAPIKESYSFEVLKYAQDVCFERWGQSTAIVRGRTWYRRLCKESE